MLAIPFLCSLVHIDIKSNREYNYYYENGRLMKDGLTIFFPSIVDGLLSWVVGKIVKVPKYIRHIKREAREKGIKGLYMLSQYLEKKIWKKLGQTVALSGLCNFVVKIFEEFIDYVISCAKQMFFELKESIGGLAIA